MNNARLRAGRRLWIGLPGREIDDDDRRHLERLRPGGLLIFRRNIGDLAQVARWIREAREIVGPQLHVAVDQEGGSVTRFYRELTVFPGNSALGSIASQELEAAERFALEQGVASGAELYQLGVSVNLAPVVDVLDLESRGIGTRSYGADFAHAIRLAVATVNGHREAGVRCCLKHYPGLGAAQEDPHFDLAHITVKEEVLRRHLRVFESIIRECPDVGIMTSHAVCDAIDPERPATLSPLVVRDGLRARSSFDGVVMSDDLEMGALSDRSFDEVVRRTHDAGHDLLLICHDRAKQRIAHDVLTELDSSAQSERHQERLDAFARLPEGRCCVDGATVAESIAQRAITVVADPNGLLPLDLDRVLVVVPRPGEEDDRCDPLRGEPLTIVAEGLGGRGRVVEYAAEPSAEDFVRIAPCAVDASALVLFVGGVRESEARRDLLRQSLQWHPKVVVVLFGDPRDAELLPRSSRAAVVVAHGFRAVHQRAIVRFLSS